MPFNAWPDIEALYNVRKTLKYLQESTGLELGPVTYRAKVKLDGTNAAVRVTLPVKIGQDSSIAYQSRTRDVTPQDDNFQFAQWATERRDVFVRAAFKTQGRVTTFYGEWCGIGIQSGTAVSHVPRRFAVFAVQVDDHVIVEPDAISVLLGDVSNTIITVLPWYGAPVTVDYADQAALEASAESLNQTVLEVEACDPWVKANFNLEGVGEGIVLYPSPDIDLYVSRERLERLMFKAKGQKHRAKESKQAVQVNPDVLASVEEFARVFVTEARCQQGLTVTCGGDASPKNTGNFMKWIVGDVEKESKDDLDASGLTFKQVVSAVQKQAREWYQRQVG